MSEVRKLLDTYGHRYCPENIKAGDLPSDEQWYAARSDEPYVAAAIRSYQTWFAADLDILCLRANEFGGLRRPSVADGEAGENTAQLLNHCRCGCPDYFHPDRLVEQGNWPPTCRDDITVSWNFDQLPGRTVEQTTEMFYASANELSTRLVLNMVIRKGEYPNTRCAVIIASLPGSVLADQELAISNCGMTSRGRMDRRDWGDGDLSTTVRIHEDLHMLGGHHVPDGISTLNPVITQAAIDRKGRLMPGDIEEMERVGYTERTEPDDNDSWLSGGFDFKDSAGNVIGRCHLAPDTKFIDTPGMIWADGISTVHREGPGRDRHFILESKLEN